MRSYKRSVRVAELLKMKISEIMIRKVNDPRLSSITITNVELTDDLRYAKIYFSVLGSEEEERRSLQGLQKATKYIKSILGEELELRYVPDLRFEIDKFYKQSIKIVDLLNEIEKDSSDEVEG
ncbi:30S ribosome-binding factor RbfA [bacterium]|nr:30S ribosome-binding factor RbfA [bacterium]